jgi:hypothetical protein
MIKRELPATVYRCKGVLHLADDPTHRYVLAGCHRSKCEPVA